MATTVWTAGRVVPFEGGEIFGVFSTRDLAKVALEKKMIGWDESVLWAEQPDGSLLFQGFDYEWWVEPYVIDQCD